MLTIIRLRIVYAGPGVFLTPDRLTVLGALFETTETTFFVSQIALKHGAGPVNGKKTNYYDN